VSSDTSARPEVPWPPSVKGYRGPSVNPIVGWPEEISGFGVLALLATKSRKVETRTEPSPSAGLRGPAGQKVRSSPQVTEYHRELTTFGGVVRDRGLRRDWQRAAGSADRGQHFQPVPERDAKIFEVLVSQIWENGNINLVLGKALSVLGQAF
jgi:hypothetical protein